jgi:hypothetical protein
MREPWLMQMTRLLAPDFAALNHPLPERLRVTCGWPSRRAFGIKRRTIGECWPATASADGSVEIFISPVLARPEDVAATLVHELVHAALGPGYGHGETFKRLALQLGLQGPMRATTAGPALLERLNAFIGTLGCYPHASLNAQARRKEGARLLKCECPTCGYTARITQRWIAIGLPVCPCGSRMMQSGHQPKKGGAASPLIIGVS